MLSSDSHVQAASGLSPLKPERQRAQRHILLGGLGLCSYEPRASSWEKHTLFPYQKILSPKIRPHVGSFPFYLDVLLFFYPPFIIFEKDLSHQVSYNQFLLKSGILVCILRSLLPG